MNKAIKYSVTATTISLLTVFLSIIGLVVNTVHEAKIDDELRATGVQVYDIPTDLTLFLIGLLVFSLISSLFFCVLSTFFVKREELRALREAKVAEESVPYISLKDAKNELGID